jgi:hypothetical protein
MFPREFPGELLYPMRVSILYGKFYKKVHRIMNDKEK